jgi:hypothetical protein
VPLKTLTPDISHTKNTHTEYSVILHVARLEAFSAAKGLISTSTWTYLLIREQLCESSDTAAFLSSYQLSAVSIPSLTLQ